jgi:hypothetical protein
MNPSELPFAQELFAQWQRARGNRMEPATRPFSRGWEDLLEDARLVSATDRGEAEHDARALALAGWLELKSVRYKPHLLDRIVMPLAAEPRWMAAFGFVPPPAEEACQIQAYPWVPALAFVREARLNLSFTELRQLNEYMVNQSARQPIIPIKERSLQIFDDEKRLDALLASALFRPDRLDEKRDLRCEVIGEPLAWKRGPAEAPSKPIIVIENAATWHSYYRWNAGRKLFSAVVYGCGNRFVDGVRYIADIFAELGGPRRVLYFGDLDPQGLLIPQEASARAEAVGLSPVEPHLWSYRQLLAIANGRGQPYEGEPPSSTLCDWLADCAEPARQLFAANQRLAQEHLGWEFLQGQAGAEADE